MNRKERRARRKAKEGPIIRRDYESGSSLEVDTLTGQVCWRLVQVDFDRFTLSADERGMTLDEYMNEVAGKIFGTL